MDAAPAERDRHSHSSKLHAGHSESHDTTDGLEWEDLMPAINRASDFCRARPGANALIVSCEFCSLCYQPDDLDVGSLLSNGLFGDAVAAAVVRGDGKATGVRLEAQTSHVIPGTDT
jgi:predicted naringenin-chalcone synthase